MSGLRVSFFLLVVSLLHSAVNSAPETTTAKPVQDIPQRCIDNSVTPVSCENVNQEDGLEPHPDDCELFYYCLSPDSEPICRQCPAKLHFNPEKRICDRPRDAGCKAGSKLGAQ